MRLKELRIQKGDLQKQVAEAIGYSLPEYSHFETGRREPNIETLKALSKYFGVSIDHIVCND